MKNFRKFCFIIIVAIAAFSQQAELAEAQDLPGRYVDLVFDRVERENDIKFGSAEDIPSGRDVDLLLDMYSPAGDTDEKRPVFIFYFGGGFVSGNKEREPRAYCELMARRGYVAVAPSYRINQGNIVTQGIPAAVSDSRQAVNWLIKNAEKYRLDPSRIIIGGSSAGAITALFTAYTDAELQAEDKSQDVALVMDLWGGLYTQINDMEPGEPPISIIHGTEDNIVPFSEAEKLRDRAEAVGIPYDFYPLQGEAHAPYMPAELMVRVAEFAYEQLWENAPEPTAEPSPTPTAEPSATPVPSPSSVPPTATSIPVPSAVPSYEIHLPALRRE